MPQVHCLLGTKVGVCPKQEQNAVQFSARDLWPAAPPDRTPCNLLVLLPMVVPDLQTGATEQNAMCDRPNDHKTLKLRAIFRPTLKL